MIQGKVLVAEMPELGRIFQGLELEETFFELKKLTPEILRLGIYKNDHSWAGSEGVQAWVVWENGEYTKVPEGGWFSDNGRIVEDLPPVPLIASFVERQDVRAVIMHSWRSWEGQDGYNEWKIYVRPKFDIRKEVRKYIENELNKVV